MAIRYPLLLAVLVLPGCITNAMWYEEEALPELLTLSVACEAVEVTTSPDAGDPSIHVRFAPRPADEMPPPLARFDAERPGVIELQPPIAEHDWRRLPGAEVFVPASWDLRITSGTYISKAPANARMVFHGEVDPAEVGELVAPEVLPRELRERRDGLRRDPGIPWEWQSVSLEAFDRHAWLELFHPTRPRTGYRRVPLAWVDGDLNVVPATDLPDGQEQARDWFESLRLLVRLEDDLGEQHFAVIRVPVLLQGTDLRLWAEGAVVRWSREQVWEARLLADVSDAGDRSPLSIPMRAESFDYRWSKELEDDDTVLDALRVLATPITAALDFAIMTNGPLSRLAAFLTGQDQQKPPFEPVSGR